MPPYGLYSLANTPEELLNRGYGYSTDIPYNQLSDAEENLMYTKYDPAFGNLNTDFGYFSAPYTGAQPFQNASFLRGERNYDLGFMGDIDLPSFGGSGNPRFNQFEPEGILSQSQPFEFLSSAYEDENEDDEQDQEYIDQVNENNQSGIMKVLRSLPTPTNLLLNMLPKPDPRETNIRNFYGNQYGLTSTGSIGSGIMAGYNPVFGSNFLNKLTGGRLPERSFGLADAARRRIERIANRKIAQTAASRAKIAALQKFAREDTTRRARFDNPNVYASADKQGFTNSSGGFKSAGTNENFSNKTGRGRTGY